MRRVDVRVLSATNRDLTQEVQHKRFHEDLYYRLNVFPITVPPLRERREEIPLLVTHFLRRSSEKLGKQVRGTTHEAIELLVRYSWPGNVRELENESERAVALTPEGDTITSAVLSEKIAVQKAVRVSLPAEASTLKQARLTFEREYVAEVLRQHQGNAVQTAKALQRFAFVWRGRSWVPSPLAGEGQGEGKSSSNESTHPNEKCCRH